LGDVNDTSLEEGIRETIEIFTRLKLTGMLDTIDLET
jgi:hypothetical protein